MMRRLNQADNKYPFEQFTFYLDLRSNPGIRARLCMGITALKGTVEEFLSKDVKYIVTDKDESFWPRNSSHQKSTGNNQEHQQQLTSNKTPTVEILSRGKLILDKASATTEGSTTTDVLETGARMGIKIISAKKMADYLESRVNARLLEMDMRSRSGSAALTTRSAALTMGSAALTMGSRSGSAALTTIGKELLMKGRDEISPSLKMKSIRAVPFVSPFIKIESDSSHRPLFKVFSHWPELSVDHRSTGCPFRPSGNTSLAWRARHPLPPSLTPATPTATVATPTVQGSATTVQGSAPTVQGSATTVQGSATTVQGSATTVQGSGKRSCFQKVQFDQNRIKITGNSTPKNTSTKMISVKGGTSNSVINNHHNETAAVPSVSAVPTVSAVPSVSAVPTVSAVTPRITTNMKQKRGYCDNCQIEFDKLNEHLKTDRHLLFVHDEDQFTELLGVIKSLPSLDDLEPKKEVLSPREENVPSSQRKRKCSGTGKENQREEEMVLGGDPDSSLNGISDDDDPEVTDSVSVNDASKMVLGKEGRKRRRNQEESGRRSVTSQRVKRCQENAQESKKGKKKFSNPDITKTTASSPSFDDDDDDSPIDDDEKNVYDDDEKNVYDDDDHEVVAEGLEPKPDGEMELKPDGEMELKPEEEEKEKAEEEEDGSSVYDKTCLEYSNKIAAKLHLILAQSGFSCHLEGDPVPSLDLGGRINPEMNEMSEQF